MAGFATNWTYRKDVDGLRAVAVSSVVLYHAFQSAIPGGFAGVDIFFVVSGYLITGILHADLSAGRHAIFRFYERRIRRIFPALFVVLAASTVLAAVLLMPLDLARYFRTLAGATVFSSNLVFWLQSGYFDPAAELKPLLHTWSLAVEEQFYLFYPPLLWLAWRFRREKALVWGGLLASFLLCIHEARHDPEACYYLFPARAWELMVGAVLALGGLPDLSGRHGLRETLAALGAALIATSLFVIDKYSPFLGALMLLPCAGTALIIYAGDGARPTLTGRLLSARPMVFVGLTSYSLYLWHWPLSAFARYANLDPLAPWQKWTLISVAMGLAVLSWRFVELPFHQSQNPAPASSHAHIPVSRRRVVAGGAGAMLAFLLICGAGGRALNTPGLVERFYGKDFERVRRQLHSHNMPRACVDSVDAALEPSCRIGNPQTDATVALWGDSFSEALLPAVGPLTQGASLYAFVHRSCPSVLGTVRIDRRPGHRNLGAVCREFNERVFAELKRHKEIRRVVMFSNFSGYDAPPSMLVPEGGNETMPEETRRQEVAEKVAETARRVAALGKEVVVVGVYDVGEKLGGAYELRAMMRHPSVRHNVGVSLAEFDAKTAVFNERLKRIERPGLVYVDPRKVFCPLAATTGFCHYDLNLPLTVDGYHLTPYGAERLVAAARQAIAEAHRREVSDFVAGNGAGPR